jgi:hypothetical protein
VGIVARLKRQLDPEVVKALLAESCAEQGVPVKVDDPDVVGLVAEILNGALSDATEA